MKNLHTSQDVTDTTELKNNFSKSPHGTKNHFKLMMMMM